MNVAFYGRYSSDNQKETSIEDQRRVVARWSERHGHVIVAEFADAAVSGANAKIRKGLQAALEAALSRPRRFEAIAVDQLSRLSRDVGDTDAMVKQLRFSGVRVIAVADGIDTADESTKISVTVKSLVNELYLDDLRKTTKRGLDGQFLKGFSTGGRTFGYRSQPVYDPSGRTDPWGNRVPIGYRLVIEPTEAAIVREIFQMFCDQHGEKWIVDQLNARHLPRTWKPSTVLFMLRNSRYAGRFHFNRREWRKHPETGRRVYRWRSPDQWETRTVDELRIVDEETWAAVQRRLGARRPLLSEGGRPPHLLSGLLICDRCDGRLSLVSSSYYGCAIHQSGACENELRIRREAVEALVIAELERWASPLKTLAVGGGRAAVRRRAVTERTPAARNEMPGAESLRRLSQVVQTDPRLGREVLVNAVAEIRVVVGERWVTVCPVCQHPFGKITPRHMAIHALTVAESYRRFPEVGFSRNALLVIQPHPDGALRGSDPLEIRLRGATDLSQGNNGTIPQESCDGGQGP
jgi:DNA invertase Pin-like site-specific DNA recombinase